MLNAVRNLIYKSVSKLSTFLVYHRFMDKPLTYFEDTLRADILNEVARVQSVISKLPETYPAMFSGGMFNQYGAFVMRDLITKELFDITKYEHSDLYQKVARNSIKSNSSPEITKVSNSLRDLFHNESNDYSTASNPSVYVKLLNDLVPLFLLKFFAENDTRNFVDSLIYAISGMLVYERGMYSVVETDDSFKAGKELEDYLFEVLNDSIGIYSYNIYEKLYNQLPEKISHRMVSVRMKQKLTREGRYFFEQKRKPSDIYLFKQQT